MNYRLFVIMFDFIDDFDEKFSLKYSGKVPAGYDVSEMMFTFEFIYLVYKQDVSIDEAVKVVSEDYGLSQEYLKDFLFKNHYILNRIRKTDLLNLIKSYNTKALKKILKANGIKASGKREKIEEKILDNNLIPLDSKLSSKSRVFYKNKKRRVRIFNKYLSDYYFDEFNEYYMDNFRKKANKIPIDYINQHVEKAITDKNHHNYVLNVMNMAMVYGEYENHKKMLECVLKVFCVNLNPVWKIDDLSNHGGLPIEIYNLLVYLNGILGKNRIISAYYAIWDSFNFETEIISKYAGYIYLKDILNNKDYNRILYDMDVKFFSNENLKVKRVVQKTLFDY